MSYAKGYHGTNDFLNPFADFEQSLTGSINAEEGHSQEAIADIQQRTIEWFLHRWDKFTGSRTPDLLKQGRGKGQEWGETAKNVIYELASYATMTSEGREQYAIEQMYKDFRQTKWGNEYELEAREAYATKTGYHVVETGFTVHPTISYMGASFDGEIIGGKEGTTRFREGITEIKCPYDPIKHLKNANLQRTGIDSKHEYYGQIQHNIEVAGVDWCDFVSYDPRQNDETKLVIIRVDRDQIFIDAILDRVHKAQKIKVLYLNGKSIEDAINIVETE